MQGRGDIRRPSFAIIEDACKKETMGDDMVQKDGHEELQTDEARGGSTPHIVRYVLGFSLLIAIILLSLVWIIPAL